MPHHCSAVFTAVHRIKATPSTKTSATQTQVLLCSSLIPHAAGILNALGQGLGSCTSASAHPYKHPTLSSSPQRTHSFLRGQSFTSPRTLSPLQWVTQGSPSLGSYMDGGILSEQQMCVLICLQPIVHTEKALAYILSIYTISKNKQNTVH